MRRSPARVMCAATMCRSLAMLLTCLSIVYSGAASSVEAQSDPRAAANQLHTAIVNGDVESLRYWLTARHADASWRLGCDALTDGRHMRYVLNDWR